MWHQLTLSRRALSRPPRTTPALAASLALALAAGPAPAQAPPPTPPVAAPSAQAAQVAPAANKKALAAKKYEDGAKLAKEGRWQEAYPPFLEAWRLFPHWQIALSLGRVEVEVGKFHAAEEHLSFAQEAPALPATDRPEVIRLLDLAKKNQGSVRLTATAQDTARIFLGDRRIGVTPFSGTITADPGEHRLELRLDSRRQSRLVRVIAGQTIDVDIDLRISETIPPTTTRPSPSLPTSLSPPTTATPPPPSVLSRTAHMALLSTSIGLTLAGLAIGTGFAITAGSSLDRDRQMVASAASYVAAGLFASSSVVLLLTLPEAPQTQATTLRLRWAGPSLQAELQW